MGGPVAHHAEVRFVMGQVDLLLSPDAAGIHSLLDALARFQRDNELPKRRKEFSRDALALVVTSSDRKAEWDFGAGTRGRLRLVLIDQTSPSARQTGIPWSGDGRQTWISIDANADYPKQLRRQWERVCHDSIAS